MDNAQNPQGPEKWQSGLQLFLDLSGYRISIRATGPCQGGPEVTAQSTLYRETVPKYISDRTPVQSRISRRPQQYFKSKGERTYRKKSYREDSLEILGKVLDGSLSQKKTQKAGSPD